MLDRGTTKAAGMNYVRIGEVVTSSSPAKLATVLGSCVALTLYNPVTRAGGMAHILISGDDRGENCRYSDPATRRLLEEVREAHGEVDGLVAKVVGGGFIKSGGVGSLLRNVGLSTALRVMSILVENSIPVVGMHVGGGYERRVVFDLETGRICIVVKKGNVFCDEDIVI